MYKSGIIFAVISVVIAICSAVLSPLCVPCVTMFLGLGAGFVAGVFDKPGESGATAKTGAIAGLIAGIGAMLGQLSGAAINAVILGPEGTIEFLNQLGIASSTSTDAIAGYWLGLVGSAICLGLLDIGLMTGAGAVGGIIWRGMLGDKGEGGTGTASQRMT